MSVVAGMGARCFMMTFVRSVLVGGDLQGAQAPQTGVLGVRVAACLDESRIILVRAEAVTTGAVPTVVSTMLSTTAVHFQFGCSRIGCMRV